MAVISWNCRGYSANYEDIRLLLHDYNAKILILQETMLGQISPRAPAGYTLFTGGITTDRRPGSGLAFLVRNDTAHAQLQLQSNLQVMAFRIQLSKIYTLCNIYISPGEAINVQDLHHLLQQLPEPIIISGDFNAKHVMWGNSNTDQRGNTIETFLIQSNVNILNTNKPTHFNAATGGTSAIDLTIVSSALSIELLWDVCEDLHGSDHWPVVLKEVINEPVQREPRYIYERADWNSFKNLTDMNGTEYELIHDDSDVNELIAHYNEIIIQAADQCIPKTSGKERAKTVPWWTVECSTVITERKRALRRYQHTRNVADKISYNRARARAKYTLHQARVTSWTKYVNSLNINTPMSKIWARVKKIRGS